MDELYLWGSDASFSPSQIKPNVDEELKPLQVDFVHYLVILYDVQARCCRLWYKQSQKKIAQRKKEGGVGSLSQMLNIQKR